MARTLYRSSAATIYRQIKQCKGWEIFDHTDKAYCLPPCADSGYPSDSVCMTLLSIAEVITAGYAKGLFNGFLIDKNAKRLTLDDLKTIANNVTNPNYSRPATPSILPTTSVKHYRSESTESSRSWFVTKSEIRHDTAPRKDSVVDSVKSDEDFPKEGHSEILTDENGEQLYSVERVLDSRLYRRQLQYKVEWAGYELDEIWYPAANFRGTPFVLQDFHTKHPDAAGPPMRLQQWLESAREGYEAEPHKKDNSVATSK